MNETEARTKDITALHEREVAEWEGWVHTLISWDAADLTQYYAGPVPQAERVSFAEGFRSQPSSEPCVTWPCYDRPQHYTRLLETFGPGLSLSRQRDGSWSIWMPIPGDEYNLQPVIANTLAKAALRMALVLMSNGIKHKDLITVSTPVRLYGYANLSK